MAKCVKEAKSGMIKRVSDIEAYNLVKTGKWQYTSKSSYKRQQQGKLEENNG